MSLRPLIGITFALCDTQISGVWARGIVNRPFSAGAGAPGFTTS